MYQGFPSKIYSEWQMLNGTCTAIQKKILGDDLFPFVVTLRFLLTPHFIKQFKYVAETTLNPSAASSPAFLSSNAAIRSTGGEHSLNLSRNLPTYSLGASDKNTDQIDKAFRADQLNDEDEEIDDAEYISDDDGEGSSPNIVWN